jgi:ABC-2 type transport system permease protein
MVCLATAGCATTSTPPTQALPEVGITRVRLQIAVLVNPLVYMCEGFRLSLTQGVPHMPVWAIYGAMAGFTLLLTWVGIDGFRRRVLS